MEASTYREVLNWLADQGSTSRRVKWRPESPPTPQTSMGITRHVRRRRGIRGGGKVVTPRRNRARVEHANSHSTPRVRYNLLPLSTPQPLSDNHSTVDTSTTSERSSSPSKSFHMTEFTSFPIDRRILIENDLPPVLKKLYQDMVAIARCEAIIPPVAQTYLKGKETLLAHNLIAQEDDMCEDTLAPDAFLVRVVELWRNAKDCYDEDSPEAAWNAEVHCQLLRLALRGKHRAHGIWYRDITSVRITDRSLLPVSSSFPVRSKLVDYGIFLEPDQSLKTRIVENLSRCEDASRSINATSSDWIRFWPLAISIETKRGGSRQAEYQLGMWTAAQLQKLHRLTSFDHPGTAWSEMPLLPLLSVTGHSWRLLFARPGEVPRLTVLDGMEFGTTVTVTGIYGVVAGLRRLATWANTEYRQWFERSVL